MWLLYILLYSFFEGLVNYFDEYLTLNNPNRKESSNVLEETGGLIIVSTLFTVCGIIGLGSYLGYSVLSVQQGIWIAFFSAVPMVMVWIGYFFMFTKYSAHHVVPLFGLGSVWLVAVEFFSGAHVTFISLIGIAILLSGSYLLDIRDLKVRVSTGLFIRMIPLSMLWAVTLFTIQWASKYNDAVYVYFYQLVGTFCIGVFLFLCVKPFRDGFLVRLSSQRGRFIGISLLVEACAQSGFLSLTLAVATAPLVAYVAAVGGLKSIILAAMLFFFPVHERNMINTSQWFAILLVVAGVFVIEFWQ